MSQLVGGVIIHGRANMHILTWLIINLVTLTSYCELRYQQQALNFNQGGFTSGSHQV